MKVLWHISSWLRLGRLGVHLLRCLCLALQPRPEEMYKRKSAGASLNGPGGADAIKNSVVLSKSQVLCSGLSVQGMLDHQSVQHTDPDDPHLTSARTNTHPVQLSSASINVHNKKYSGLVLVCIGWTVENCWFVLQGLPPGIKCAGSSPASVQRVEVLQLKLFVTSQLDDWNGN